MERRTTEPTAISTSRYRAELVKLMSFKDDKTYDASHSFTAEKLISITPTLVCHWMNKRAYGDPEPNEDIRSIHVRSSIAKKAVSAFMPRLNKTWDPVAKQGKPTRSDDVNKLIKANKIVEITNQLQPHDWQCFDAPVAYYSTNRRHDEASI
ncbi:hypothetical protein F441_15097 [Phytophthora nicotianae CJ01A1]|uniref:Uncharacterized protein n=3 Tax=Phytophthora nicotianae TaxID=4792 RepID=W2WF44_PHYNI|nr:hypothetical protein L915_14825 [Phytophthora nicotianae]ETP09002.1 hypothetical protein F441_15097 [Phytophthora nicotianae CJ01A1]